MELCRSCHISQYLSFIYVLVIFDTRPITAHLTTNVLIFLISIHENAIFLLTPIFTPKGLCKSIQHTLGKLYTAFYI